MRRRRLFNLPVFMMVFGFTMLVASGVLWVEDRFSYHVPYPGDSFVNGVFIQDDQHGMGCHFNLHTPMMECMPDEQWMGRDLEREAEHLRELNKDIKQLLEQHEQEVEELMWDLLKKQGLIWSA